MKKTILLLLICLTFGCTGSAERAENVFLTVSPIINQENSTNSLIISALNSFLQSKNNSLSENYFWATADFQTYVYPYLDIYNIEESSYGKGFYKPTVMEILPTENENRKIVKIAFIGHHSETKENLIKSIYNVIANIEGEKITFSRYLDFATKNWTRLKAESINYIISPNRQANMEDVQRQRKEIDKLSHFFEVKPIDITYYSCIDPKELFEIKGFDYHPMMYVDKTGGLAEYGNIIFSGDNSESYTHEIIHIYTNNLYPALDKFIDEGLATFMAGSGKYTYEWHRNKFAKFLKENENYNFVAHTDVYERSYFEDETSIPYVTSALILERTLRIYGKDGLMELLKSEGELWTILKTVGLTQENIADELRKEINLPSTLLWN